MDNGELKMENCLRNHKAINFQFSIFNYIILTAPLSAELTKLA